MEVTELNKLNMQHQVRQSTPRCLVEVGFRRARWKLNLWGWCKVTDEGLRPVAGLTSLAHLNLGTDKRACVCAACRARWARRRRS
jgi:hypothetical protein